MAKIEKNITITIALKAIIENCKENSDCSYCPFTDTLGAYRCYFEVLSPDEWDINEIIKRLEIKKAVSR